MVLLFSILIIILSPFIVVFIIPYIISMFNKNKPKKKLSINGTVVIPIILLLFILFITYIIMKLPYSNESDKIIIKNSIDNNEYIAILAEDFIAQFLNDPIKSNELYRAKIVQITGKINYIGLPIDNPPYKDNSYIQFSDTNDNIIICFFTNNEIVPKLKNTKENKIITVIGKYRDYGNYENEIYIKIGDCEIINK